MRGKRALMGAAAVATSITLGSSGALGSTGGAARPSTPVPGTQVACEPPYLPWHEAPQDFEPPYDERPDVGESIVLDVPSTDTDADGKPDNLWSTKEGEGHIGRGDGSVILLRGDHELTYPSGGIGDLDGDGHDEVLIITSFGAEEAPAFLLPGTTPVGEHLIDDVGIRLDGIAPTLSPVHDVDGDGGDDLAHLVVDDVDSRFEILNGTELMAPGPGGTLGSIEPLATYPGLDLLVGQPAGADRPLIVTFRRVADELRATVGSNPPVELLSTGASPSIGGTGDLRMTELDGQVFIGVGTISRSPGTETIWNLDDPCARYAATPTPTSPGPTPAAPVPGSAAYTG